MRDLIGACAPVLPKALHPELAAKAAIHHLARILAPPVHKAQSTISHVVASPYHVVVRQVSHAIRRHAYMAPKIVAHAKVAAVCTVLGVGGGLGAGVATDGLPSLHSFAGATPPAVFSPHANGASQSGPVPIPEPSSLSVLAAAGAVLFGVVGRRRRGRAPAAP